jgi:hypothetical protein
MSRESGVGSHESGVGETRHALSARKSVPEIYDGAMFNSNIFSRLPAVRDF